MSMAIEDYLEKYTAHCKKKKMTPLAGLVKKLTEAIDTGDLIEEFVLKGNIPELKMNRINDDAVDPIVHPLSSLGFLKVLDLSFNELGDKGATNIAKYIKNDSVLEVLILKSNKIGSNGIISISKALHYNSQICYLDLSNNTIGDEGGMAVANMMQVNASITNLFISGCKLPATSLIAIATVLQANNYIQQLDMSNNMLSTGTLSQTLQNDVMTHISTSIAMNYGIKVLNLSKSGISDYIMCHLLAPAMKANRNIETLDLSCNRITRDGGVALCEALAINHSVNFLKLSCCAIQDEGAGAVAGLLRVNVKLKEIYLDYNRITGIGLLNIANALEQNVMMKYVALWGNQWDTASCEAFSKLLGGPSTIVEISNSKAFAKKDKTSRFGPNAMDIAFCRVEGVLQVVHMERLE